MGGIPEVVGDAGILCKENEKSLADGIIELLESDEKYNSLKENAKKRRELFDWDLIAERVKSVYEKTLNMK